MVMYISLEFHIQHGAQRSLQHQNLALLVGLIATHDNAFAWLQSLKHFIILRVLSAYGDLAPVSLVSILVQNKYPLSTSHTVEGSLGDE